MVSQGVTVQIVLELITSRLLGGSGKNEYIGEGADIFTAVNHRYSKSLYNMGSKT